MLAKDLMIGDIVMFDDEPVEIREFLGLEKCIVANKKGIKREAIIDSLEPMKITYEFLRANHWKRDLHIGSYWYHPQNEFLGKELVLCHVDGFYQFKMITKKVEVVLAEPRYIHEVQHILRAMNVSDAFELATSPVDKLKLAQQTLVKNSKMYQLLQEVIDELEEKK